LLVLALCRITTTLPPDFLPASYSCELPFETLTRSCAGQDFEEEEENMKRKGKLEEADGRDDYRGREG
jgi:hypothetical protein